MAYISKITPLGSSTTYDLKASLLINTHVTSEAAAIPATKGLFGVYTITSDSSGLSNDGHILSGTWHNNDSNFGYQLFIDTDPTYKMALRQRNSSGVWQAWKLIPMADGTNASGTWGISITGNAATATALSTSGTTAKFWRGDNTWSDTISGGTLKITANSNTTTIGSQNASFCHIYNSANIPFIFNNSVLTTGGNLGNSDYPFDNLTLGRSNGAGIYYKGSKATYRMIRFIDNTSDTYGNGISIGGGGQTIIGGGESADTAAAQAGTAGGEIMQVCNDGDVQIISNLQNGWDNRKVLTLNTSGYLMCPSYINVPTSNNENPTLSQFIVTNGSDNYYRKASAAHAMAAIRSNASGSWGISITGNAATATALTSNAGSTTQPIYFTGGKPAVTSYSLSASVGSGTNHKLIKYTGTNSIGDSGIEDIDQIGYSTVTPGYTSGGEQYYKAWMAYLCTHYSNANVMIGTALPNSRGPVIGNIYDVNTKDSTTGLPQYATFLFHNLGAHLESFGTSSYSYWHRTYLDDNNYTSYTDSRYVKKAGDTMTGNLIVSKTGDTYVEAKNTTTGCRIEIDVNDAGKHGIWSSGYYANSTYTASSKWIYYRGTDGEAHSDVKIYGAVWNDYAEYRKDNPNEIQEPGRCVRELGNGVLALTTKRLERGCEIVSDTFGFAIGQDEENGYNTPIASNGRVLAYIYEGREYASTHIGWPVCSGPNGTVSIMTDEEYQKYGYCAIGTISEIPDYEEWGTEKVKVDGRVWIRIR